MVEPVPEQGPVGVPVSASWKAWYSSWSSRPLQLAQGSAQAPGQAAVLEHDEELTDEHEQGDDAEVPREEGPDVTAPLTRPSRIPTASTSGT